MLFRKEIEPSCLYCTKGTPTEDGLVACLKRGVVASTYHCRAFRYDPLRRTPPPPAPRRHPSFSAGAFSLDEQGEDETR